MNVELRFLPALLLTCTGMRAKAGKKASRFQGLLGLRV